MDIGYKIKQLRFKHSLTQEQLAERLGISSQAISKWETAVSMPDITMLPVLAEVFGIAIDELFDLTDDQKMRRIVNRIHTEDDIAPEIFQEYETFLKERIMAGTDKQDALNTLARLYHHKMESYGRKAGDYARKAILMAPAQKDCQWILQKTEGSTIWDWNIENHAKTIDFYKSVIDEISVTPHPPLPYYYLIQELIADHRIQEAEEYLDILRELPGCRNYMIPVYEAHIALAGFDERKADAVMERALAEFFGNSGLLFQAAQYYARKCEYDKAIELYDASYNAEGNEKPRFTDALEAIAMIYEIRGDYAKAADTFRRILDAQQKEWGISEEEIRYRRTMQEIMRLENMSRE